MKYFLYISRYTNQMHRKSAIFIIQRNKFSLEPQKFSIKIN